MLNGGISIFTKVKIIIFINTNLLIFLFQGGHLASVHGNDENNFLMVNMKRNNIDNAFLGLHVNNDDQLEWTDGTVLDYESWNTGGL